MMWVRLGIECILVLYLATVLADTKLVQEYMTNTCRDMQETIAELQAALEDLRKNS